MQHDFESSPRNEENQIHRNLCAHNISKPRQAGNNSAKYRLIYIIIYIYNLLARFLAKNFEGGRNLCHELQGFMHPGGCLDFRQSMNHGSLG